MHRERSDEAFRLAQLPLRVASFDLLLPVSRSDAVCRLGEHVAAVSRERRVGDRFHGRVLQNLSDHHAQNRQSRTGAAYRAVCVRAAVARPRVPHQSGLSVDGFFRLVSLLRALQALLGCCFLRRGDDVHEGDGDRRVSVDGSRLSFRLRFAPARELEQARQGGVEPLEARRPLCGPLGVCAVFPFLRRRRRSLAKRPHKQSVGIPAEHQSGRQEHTVVPVRYLRAQFPMGLLALHRRRRGHARVQPVSSRLRQKARVLGHACAVLGDPVVRARLSGHPDAFVE